MGGCSRYGYILAMIRGMLTFSTLVSIVFFPWPFTAALALIASLTEPLVPLAAGIVADTLYYGYHAYALPLFTLYGALLTALALLVRSRLMASSITQ